MVGASSPRDLSRKLKPAFGIYNLRAEACLNAVAAALRRDRMVLRCGDINILGQRGRSEFTSRSFIKTKTSIWELQPKGGSVPECRSSDFMARQNGSSAAYATIKDQRLNCKLRNNKNNNLKNELKLDKGF
ncbi:hypothetical protein BB427_01985 [Pseudoalteromonas sp. BMB]|nr:hypothetical protein BB427_01985 [Pseudoalteromonas sp. BMB]